MAMKAKDNRPSRATDYTAGMLYIRQISQHSSRRSRRRRRSSSSARAASGGPAARHREADNFPSFRCARKTSVMPHYPAIAEKPIKGVFDSIHMAGPVGRCKLSSTRKPSVIKKTQ
jgi:hypothetical protein